MANTTLTLLAAGSLRSAFLPLVAHFRQHTGLAVDAQFGPAGLLRERIEAGAPCAVFASANAAHPQALLQAGLAQECQGFAGNQLMLTARRSPDNDGLDWLALLSTPRLRLATSTPGCDPSGDYTWQLFARIEARSVSYTHLRAHETRHDLVCRLLLEKKKHISDPTRRTPISYAFFCLKKKTNTSISISDTEQT